MNFRPKKPKPHHSWTAEQEAALRHLSEATQQVKEADTPTARAQLNAAVDAARVAGIGWTKIGDTLGIASGNAYQRYRRRPISPQQRCDAGGSH